MHLSSLIAALAAASPAAASPVTGHTASDVRDLPVIRDGSRLLLDGKPWKAVGANVYWLGLDENVVPPATLNTTGANASSADYYAPLHASYPTKGRVTEVMATVRALGGTAIRAHTLGVSTGNPLSVWPSPHAPNARAFAAIDWAVFEAHRHGLRLLVPLTDNYDYYHGGKFTFLRWAGYTIAGTDTANPIVGQFYRNATVVALYHDYIRALLTHVNPYTNTTYAADPTIFAYETGNELTGARWLDMDVPVAWLQATARLIKELAPHKLVVDGTYGVSAAHLAVADVDIVSDHAYPVSAAKMKEDADRAAAANKTFLAGEYSWTGNETDLGPFFRELESHEAVAGDMFWSLFGHNVPDCHTFVNHSDGLTLQYGNAANTADVTRRIQRIRQHLMAAGQNTSIAADAALPTVPCPGE